MQVPSLTIKYNYIAIDKDGNESELIGWSVTGCWNMVFELEKSFGIKTNTSTVYRATKTFTPEIFKYGKTKDWMLAWANWALNYPKEERADFFENEIDRNRFYENNPIVDLKIRLSKNN